MKIEELLKNECITDSTLIIAETDREEKITKEIKNIDIKIIDKRKYGRAYIVFLKKINRKEE